MTQTMRNGVVHRYHTQRKVLCDRRAEDAMRGAMLRRGMCRADVVGWVWAFSESDAAVVGLSVLLQ